jgi:hypothetical protein
MVVTSQRSHAEDGLAGKGCLVERAEPDRRHFVRGCDQEAVGAVQKMGAASFIAEYGTAPGFQRVEPGGKGWMVGALDHLLTSASERDGLLRSSCLQRQMTKAAVDQTGQGGFAACLGEDKRLLEMPLCQGVVPRIVSHPAGEIGEGCRGTEHFLPVSGWLGTKEARSDLDREVSHDGAVHVCASEHPVGRTELSENLAVMRLMV